MLKTFKKFGFGPNLIHFISVLMKDTQSCVNYAGWLSSYFQLKLASDKAKDSFSNGLDIEELNMIKIALC